jgi:hypothetical protein
MKFVRHVSEDEIERYALLTVPDAACWWLEEHLLLCPECRERLITEEVFLAAMRSAAAAITKSAQTEKGKAASA